jgi:hypothetical protein
MTCGVALQSVRQSGGILILPRDRLRNGNLLLNHGYTVTGIPPVLDGRNRRALTTIARMMSPRQPLNVVKLSDLAANMCSRLMRPPWTWTRCEA